MKSFLAQLLFFFNSTSNRRTCLFLGKLFTVLCLLISLYSYLFHVFMDMEGRPYSVITGVYWTLVVMSTLGFGDITFTEDPGKIFTLIVLFTGILFFALVMPFTFIRFIYTPWLEARNNTITPRDLPEDTKNHVVIVGNDHFALSLANRLKEYAIPYVLLVPDVAQGLSFYDKGFKVVVGPLDSALTYQRLRVDKAALVIALYDDMKNTNIAATVREISLTVPLAAGVNHSDSVDIVRLAGANHVFHFAHMLGKIFARRVFVNQHQSNLVRNFEDLFIAEAPLNNTEFNGKTIQQCDFRKRFNLNVLGIWQGHGYLMPKPNTIVTDQSVLLLAGTETMLRKFNEYIGALQIKTDIAPVLILGGGTVGTAVANALALRNIPYKVVEKNASRIPPKDPRYVYGSAAHLEVLKKAGIDQTNTVIVTTHDDDANIYLTIYCRKLRPDIQVLSRANLDTNVASLYTAGANLVLSQVSLTVTAIVNLLLPERLFTLTEGLHLFRVQIPPALVGVSLQASGIRTTECNLAAIKRGDKYHIPPEPDMIFAPDDELFLVGSKEAEKIFMKNFKPAL